MAVFEHGETEQNFNDDYLLNRDPRQQKVESFFRPLESNWNLIKDVLLWKIPVLSLLVFVVVNGIFLYFSTGNFRLFLIGSILTGLSLCIEDIRSKVAMLLERAGITPEERESYEASLVYQRFCYKIALIWGFTEHHAGKLRRLKEDNAQKYYAVLVFTFVTVAFAYQYIPWLKFCYCIFVFLYLWPPVKYHGTHRVVIGVIEPFFRPFITHWKHSRTRRQREQLLKVQKGTFDQEDSEDEFTKEFSPQVPRQNETISVQEPKKDSQEPVHEYPSHSQLKLDSTEDIQGSFDQEDSSLSSDSMRLDIPPSQSNDLQGTGSSSVSLNSSASFLPDSQELPSLSTTTDHWEFEDEDFAQGLEFPDIDDKDYRSSNESLNALENKSHKKQSFSKKGTKRELKRAKESSEMQPKEGDVSDFELLDKSEIDDMDPEEERPGSSSSLGAMGKWLGL